MLKSIKDPRRINPVIYTIDEITAVLILKCIFNIMSILDWKRGVNMLFMDKYYILIIQKLIKANTMLNSEALASVLGITSKTVRKDIELIDKVLKNAGATVVSKPGMGYRLVLNDEDEFNIFLQSFQEKYRDSSYVPDYNEERVNYIIHHILIQDDYIRSEELSDALYISASTFATELKTVKEILEKYHLSILHKTGKGLIVGGEEFHKRIAITDFYQIHEENQYSLKKDFRFFLDSKEVRDTIEEVFIENKICVSLEGLLEICNYVIVAEYRLRKGYFVKGNPRGFLLMEEEKRAAETIVSHFFEDISEEEIQMLAMLIASRRSFGLNDTFSIERHKEYYFLNDEIFQYLLQQTNIDFYENSNFRQMLARELRSMSIRIQIRDEIKKQPVIESKNSGIPYKFAVSAYDFLHRKYGWNLSEDEIAVLTNVFELFVTEKEGKVKKQKVCVISRYGKGVAITLFGKIRNYFEKYIDTVDYLEFYELSVENARQWDFVITDIPRSKYAEFPIAIYQLQYGVTVKEIGKLRQYFLKKNEKIDLFINSLNSEWYVVGLKTKNRDEVFHYISEKIADDEISTKDLYKMMSYRERLSSCERGNNTAEISTLYPIRNKTQIGLFILERPIKWKKEIVQIVFVIARGEEADSIIYSEDQIKHLINDINFICAIIHSKDFYEVQTLMNESLQNVDNLI